MISAGRLLLLASVVVIGLLAPVGAGVAGSRDEGRSGPRVFTDGRLRPGHLETIRVAGFPGRGLVQVSFFPTAICEIGCGARSFRVGKTTAGGAGTFRVRMPGTFFNYRERHVFFRDGERIDVNVTWEGPNEAFAFANAEPEPILVRTKGSRGG